MQTRKDLLQAHRLMTQRAAQALMLGEPDSPELPMRRMNVSTFVGVMIALLVAAAFGIVGLLTGGGGAQGLQQAGTLIIEKETGARYVWCLDDSRKLCPVANYASAKLLADPGQGQRLVSRNSLTNFQRGTMLGIPGAPDTLPDPKKLVKMPWSACVRATDLPNAGLTSLVTLTAGKSVGGQPLRDNQALIVQADNQPWIIWRNRRMRVAPAVLPGLASTSAAQVPLVAGKWLNAVAPGSDFAGPVIPQLGQVVTGPQGPARAGQLFTVANVSGSTSATYVLLPDGLARVSEIEATLLQADPAVRQALGANAVQPTRLPPDVFQQARQHQGTISKPDLQGAMPTFLQYNNASPLCATYSDPTGNTGGQVTLGASLPPPPASANGGQDSADQLDFPPGGAALVGVLPSPGKASSVNTVFLVTEGKRFALASKDVAQKLGYDLGRDAVPVPAGVVSLVPNGPVLDPNAARNPIPQGGQSG